MITRKIVQLIVILTAVVLYSVSYGNTQESVEILTPQTFPQFSMGELNLVEFYSDGCDSSIEFEKRVLELISEFENVSIGKINTDEFPDFTKELPFKIVPNQPTVVFFAEGKPLDGFIGYNPNSKIREQIKAIQHQRELEKKMESGEINFKEAFDFTLKSFDGEEFTLSEATGLIILDFWATWCPPCKEEIPYLQKFYDQYKDKGLSVVGISSDKIEKVNEFRETQKKKGVPMNYLFLSDVGNKVAKQYAIRNIPTTFFISPAGKLIKKEVGFSLEVLDEFKKMIEEHLPK
ncbi:MAG: redoxin domain-containing protein [Candidatus Cloacimonadota bacterium]|nr:redoxin domain-containing protein [Candidatus Cloacimonadota bacterium]